jgi:hypothetical protein
MNTEVVRNDDGTFSFLMENVEISRHATREEAERACWGDAFYDEYLADVRCDEATTR